MTSGRHRHRTSIPATARMSSRDVGGKPRLGPRTLNSAPAYSASLSRRRASLKTAAGGDTVRAFVPASLPPVPPLDPGGGLQRALEAATLALGRLDGVSSLLPDTSLFLYTYVRKEAVLSSQIEGTQSSLSDLLLFELEEAPGVPRDDVVEVSNYVAALEHGLARLREGFPLANRLIREIHGVLLSRGRGSGKGPGACRSWYAPGSPTCSSRRFIPSSTGTGASAGSSSRSCSATPACCASRSST